MTPAGPRPDLTRLFRPRSVAVIGASTTPTKAGGAAFQALSFFPGPVYAINSRVRRGARGEKWAPRLSDVGEQIDLAILTVPADTVPLALRECGTCGVGAAVICAGGFAETGSEGAALQAELAEIAGASGIRILGPNTSGFVAPWQRLAATFMPSATGLRPGSVAVVAQSGGMNFALAFIAHTEGAGLSLAVGLGNAVDVGFADVLDHLVDDDQTSAIALHIEGVEDGRELVDIVRETVPRKPIVALKVGRTAVADFARSHTGNLAGSWELTRAALEQAGAVVVDGPTELADAAAALTKTRLPAKKRIGVGVVTGQAGPGLLLAERLDEHSLELPPLAERTRERLTQLLPPLTYQKNPVDTGRPGETFAAVTAAVGEDPAIDVLAVYALREAGTDEIMQALASYSREGQSPPLVVVTGGLPNEINKQRELLWDAGVPAFLTPERGAAVIRALVADARARAQSAEADRTVRDGVPRIASTGSLDEAQAKTLLDQLGFHTPARRVCSERAAAHQALTDLGPPVVAKLCHPLVEHKSDIGAVRLGIHTAAELDAALDDIDRAADNNSARYLIERQAPPGRELIIGAVRDPVFGPSVLFGLGGVDVELAPPPALRLAPLTSADAAAMIETLPAAVLEGGRGLSPLPTESLNRLLVQISDLVLHNAHIREIEINPLRATADDVLALDALVISG